jgi:inorganic pyrophosphatase
MLFNYGAISQTWEDPAEVHPLTGAGGDSDPIDVIELGSKGWSSGSLVAVKLLGCLAMIDEGETDWKLIGISATDPLAARMHEVEDIDVYLPGAIDALRHWLTMYKSPEKINTFANEGKPLGRKFAVDLVEDTHAAWARLIAARGNQALVTKATPHNAAATAAAAVVVVDARA